MKKHILIIVVLVSTVLQACKKDKQPNVKTDDIKHTVTFNISGFEQVIEPTGFAKDKKRVLADTSLRGQYLVCLYYKADGTFISEETRSYDYDDPDNENYGVFKKDLSAGDYTAIFFAYNEFDEYRIEDGYIYYDEHSNEDYPDPLSNIYSKRINFSITSQTGDIAQSVIMQRYFGTLAVQITDALPANVTSIETQVNDWYGMNIFEDTNVLNRGYTIVKFNKVLTGQAGVINYLVNTDSKILSTGGPVQVTIIAYNNSSVITKKVLPNVNFYKNTKTILRGKLFESNQTGNNAGFSTSFETFLPDSITAEF